MTIEQPLIAAVVARLAFPTINLAAWGIVFSVAVIIQSPSTMLLAASTTLSKDWDSYHKLRRYMWLIVVALTSLHATLVFTPLYYVLAINLLNLPPEIIQPTRLGLMIMLPWTAGTAYRRFQQGVLIRFDNSRVVIWGSILRVGVDSLLLTAGFFVGGMAGVVVAAGAVIGGVISEAAYVGYRVRPVLEHQLKAAPLVNPPLTRRAFWNFYAPLALTVLFMLLAQPLIGAGLSRMPSPLESLAVWPVLYGFLLVWQSVGISYNEAVIALLDEARAVPRLRRFTRQLIGLTTLGLFLVTVTPAAAIWFSRVAALPPDLADLAQQALWLGLLLPALRILQSWFQGALTYSRHTRGITESVVLALLVTGIILWAGVSWGQATGVYVGVLALTTGSAVQTTWLWVRGRSKLQALENSDTI